MTAARIPAGKDPTGGGMLRCPKCGGTKINQYRMPFGAMWCMECEFRIEEKKISPNPFVEAAKEFAEREKQKPAGDARHTA
jgi:transcription initiation factor TFIIIB Brf1 subunit/transcription initiation factor TFIIB